MIFRKKMTNLIVMAVCIASQSVLVHASDYKNQSTIQDPRNEYLKQWDCQNALSDDANKVAHSDPLLYAGQGGLKLMGKVMPELNPLLGYTLSEKPGRGVLTKLFLQAEGTIQQYIINSSAYGCLPHQLSYQAKRNLLAPRWENAEDIHNYYLRIGVLKKLGTNQFAINNTQELSRKLSQVDVWMLRLPELCSKSPVKSIQNMSDSLNLLERCSSAVKGKILKDALQGAVQIVQCKAAKNRREESNLSINEYIKNYIESNWDDVLSSFIKIRNREFVFLMQDASKAEDIIHDLLNELCKKYKNSMNDRMDAIKKYFITQYFMTDEGMVSYSFLENFIDTLLKDPALTEEEKKYFQLQELGVPDESNVLTLEKNKRQHDYQDDVFGVGKPSMQLIWAILLNDGPEGLLKKAVKVFVNSFQSTSHGYYSLDKMFIDDVDKKELEEGIIWEDDAKRYDYCSIYNQSNLSQAKFWIITVVRSLHASSASSAGEKLKILQQNDERLANDQALQQAIEICDARVKKEQGEAKHKNLTGLIGVPSKV